jgi:hypothetical protein
MLTRPSVLKVYPPLHDPFKDDLEDELIGVGFLYLDGLQYLLDVDENVPLINMAGRTVGVYERVRQEKRFVFITKVSYINY